MGGEFGFRRKQRESPQNEDQSGKARRQKIQRKCCHKNEYDAHSSRDHRTRVVELDVQRKRTNSQNQKSNIRIHQIGQYALLERHVEKRDGLGRDLQRNFLTIKPLETFAINLLHQVALIRSDVVDQVLLQRFLIRE